MALKGILPALACVLTVGCAVGPDFKRPAAPQVSGYTSAPLAPTVSTPGVAGGEAQRFTSGADIAADWWTLFHSKPLNDLIDQALKNSHDLKAAQAALTAARENTRAQRGANFPSVSASFSIRWAIRSSASATAGSGSANDSGAGALPARISLSSSASSSDANSNWRDSPRLPSAVSASRALR